MNHRERVLCALEHKEPDRVPLDDAIEWAHLHPWVNAANHLGVKTYEKLRERLGIDCRRATWADLGEIKPPVSQAPGTVTEDDWKVRHEIAADGIHSRVVYHPLQHVSLNEFKFPDLDKKFEKMGDSIKNWQGKYFVQGNMSCTFFETARSIRGFDTFIIDLYANSGFVNELLDRLLKYRLDMGKRFVELGVDCIQLGDDVGAQTGMLLHPSLWRKYFKPRMKTLIDELKKAGNVYIWYHSDGNVEPIIPDLIEIGVNILNPVQPDCMDPAKLKALYGDKLTLHGTISVQETMHFGSKGDVKREVIKRIQTCGHGGGLVIGPAHGLQPTSPFENIIALYETAKKYGRYPIR
jgi:hypothetical protein